jgi:hypothetical protein
MPLSPQAISRLLPPGLPDFELPERALRAFREIEGGAENPYGRSFLWSLYVMMLYRNNLSSVLEHFQWAKFPDQVQPSVGFFPIDWHIYTHAAKYLSDANRELGVFFGAVLYDRRFEPPPIQPYPLPTSPSISVVQFPVVFVLHSPIDPANAASTCWAKDVSNIEGVLTCKHAVAGLATNSNVAMANGSTGRLISFGAGAVDAAFIETQGGVPSSVKQLAIEDHPVNGSTVSANFRSRHVRNAQILNSWYFADNLDPYNAMRVFIDHWGQPADSGSLVSTTSTKGVGIYTGTFAGNGTQQGICQYLLQAVDQLSLTPHI